MRRTRTGVVAAAAILVAAAPLAAQDSGYRTPPDAIRRILDAPETPAVLPSPDGAWLALLQRRTMPGIEEVAQPVLALAGIRINPRTNGPAGARPIESLAAIRIEDGTRLEIEVSENARISHVQWSPDGRHLAFANTVDAGIELWIADVRDGSTRRLTGPVLNAAIGSAYEWMPDGRALLVQTVPPQRGPPPDPPENPRPIVQHNDSGALPVRTFTGLLETEQDERLLEHYLTSTLMLQPIDGSAARSLGVAGIFTRFRVAPGGDHVLITRAQRPYSRATTLSSFGRRTDVIDTAGTVLFTVEDVREVRIPARGPDAVNPGPRVVDWRADAPATLAWVEAVDAASAGLDPSATPGLASRTDSAIVRDRIVLLAAPFTGAPQTLVELEGRYAGAYWGNDRVGLVRTRSAKRGIARTYVVDPSRPGVGVRSLRVRSTGDRLGDPGIPVTRADGTLQLAPDSRSFFVTGASEGLPRLARVDLETGAIERLWQAQEPYHEYVIAVLDDDARRLLTRRESETDPPNYVVRDRTSGNVRALTSFADPAPELAGVRRRVLRYTRDDGLGLSASLYTPTGYDAARDGPLPTIVWAYPREYRDAAAAGQTTRSDNRFHRPSGLSPLLLLAAEYAVLDGPDMPIVGDGGRDPNDTFVEQLTANARAAVDAAVATGIVDPDRIAVAGHSYGAFMVANLLAHTDLFAAGIALSGAYNRTLTPFGFQMEQRSYWEARDTYDRMSPFHHADAITEPLLLIHGAADPNPGTYPMQSERMYQALAGLGRTVRYVLLPHEGHNYAARESVMHVMAEIIAWLERYVRP